MLLLEQPGIIKQSKITKNVLIFFMPNLYLFEFLKKLLEYNKFTVVVVPSPPPKAAPAPVLSETEAEQAPLPPVISADSTVGVSDYTFNPINAIFGRLLHTPDGHVVTLAYWQQKEMVSHDEIPYFESDRVN